jgi:membrane associated rhomboid family serine protease
VIPPTTINPFEAIDPSRLFAVRLISAIRRPPRATRALMGAILVTFVFQFAVPFLWHVPLEHHGAARDILTIALGAKVNAFIAQGQWWRLAACVFQHAGFLHLFMNLMALQFLGQVFEGVFGAARFLAVFFASGLVASLTSLAFSAHPSVGASGAVFGALGGVAVFGLRSRAHLLPPLKRHFLVNPLIWIGVNVALGLAIPGVDNAAHAGGLVFGSLLTLFLRDQVDPRPGSPARDGAVRFLAAALALLALGAVGLGASQAFTGLRYPAPAWRPAALGDATVVLPTDWQEGFPDGTACSSVLEVDVGPVLCRSDSLGARYVALTGPPGVDLDPGPPRQERNGMVIYSRQDPAGATYLLAFPAFLESVYRSVWEAQARALGSRT